MPQKSKKAGGDINVTAQSSPAMRVRQHATIKEWPLWLTPPWLWVFVYAPPRIRSVLSGWLDCAVWMVWMGRFPVAPEGFNAVLGQLAAGPMVLPVWVWSPL